MFWKKSIDLLFPPRCAVCDGLITSEDKGICDKCRGSLSYVTGPRCFCCGKTVESEETEYCGDCRKRKHSFDRGFPLLHYVPPVSDAMAAMKYHGRAEYAAFYGSLLAECFGREWETLKIDCLIPVPVHKDKLKKRGYNQAELLAEALGEILQLPVDNRILIRGEDTRAQKKLSRDERFMNLRSAFQPGSVTPPETVLLVDDIYTTGATADACAEVLFKAGAERVYITTVCC